MPMHSPNVLGAPMSWSTSPDPYKSTGEAEQGNTQEHLGFWPALKVYKPAVFWITALSFAVMLGGYNQSLLDAAISGSDVQVRGRVADMHNSIRPVVLCKAERER